MHARCYALVWLVVPSFSSSLVPNGYFSISNAVSISIVSVHTNWDFSVHPS